MKWQKILFGTWSWKRPFYSIGFVYLALLCVTIFAADFFIFRPPSSNIHPNKKGFLEFQSQETELKISAYYLPPKPSYPILFWSHGNAEDLASLHTFMDQLHALGFGIFAYDYPGYGQSEGTPTEQTCYDAAFNGYEYLTHSLGYDKKQVILCGQSVGTGPTTWLASKVEHRSMILISPFLSAFRSVTRIPMFPSDRFPNLKHIKKIHTPLLIIHGENDTVIPHSQGERLFQESSSPDKIFLSVPEAGHNDLYSIADEEIFAAFEKFRKRALATP